MAGLLEMESLAPKTRGCRFQWEADSLIYHSRFSIFYDLLLLGTDKQTVIHIRN